VASAFRRNRELFDGVLARRFDLGDDALVHAAFRRAIERRAVDTLDGDALRRRERDDLVHAVIAARRHPEMTDASCLQRFSDRVDPKYQHHQ
jgi:hypothetical protein